MLLVQKSSYTSAHGITDRLLWPKVAVHWWHSTHNSKK